MERLPALSDILSTTHELIRSTETLFHIAP